MPREARVSRREKTLGVLSKSCQIRTRIGSLPSSGGVGEVGRVRHSRDRTFFCLELYKKSSVVDFVFETTEVKLAWSEFMLPNFELNPFTSRLGRRLRSRS